MALGAFPFFLSSLSLGNLADAHADHLDPLDFSFDYCYDSLRLFASRRTRSSIVQIEL